MAEYDSGERTEDPTQQRREDFRKRGQVAQTRELGAVLMIGVGLLVILLAGQFFIREALQLFAHSVTDHVLLAARNQEWLSITKVVFTKSLALFAPVLVIFWVIGMIASITQVGFLYNEEALQFKFERIDPVSGFSRIFTWRAIAEGIKAIIKVIVVGVLVYIVLKSEVERLPYLVSFGAAELMTYIGTVTIKLFGSVLALMVVLSGLDYFFQRWDLEKQMRMTKQEIKEELKSREGDPLIKARIRRVQRQLANKRMMEDVPKADVIVTNPTHIAVALKYDETMVSPKIVAMGADYIAEKIKRLASEHGIPIVENKPLARAIFKTLKIGQMIPRELYTAVAEVLSYVYRLKNKSRGGV